MSEKTFESLHYEDHKRLGQELGAVQDYSGLEKDIAILQEQTKDLKMKSNIAATICMAALGWCATQITDVSNNKLGLDKIDKKIDLIEVRQNHIVIEAARNTQGIEGLLIEIQDRKNYTDRLEQRVNTLSYTIGKQVGKEEQ